MKNDPIVDTAFSLFRLGIIAWIIGGIFSLGLIGTVIYVAFHFLMKVW